MVSGSFPGTLLGQRGSEIFRFKNLWHYLAPIGAPQEGAFHFISGNGLQFNSTPNIPSDPQHNWTGNLMIENDNEMRFYGCGPCIWYRSTPDGGQCLPPVNTNIHGGDPGVVKTGPGHYVMIFVGLNPPPGMPEPTAERVILYPNPAQKELHIVAREALSIEITGLSGRSLLSLRPSGTFTTANISTLPAGIYLVKVFFPGGVATLKFIHE
ncbi:MAG: T9SS type A sorting domain-containing protein [bacterium]